MRRLALLFLALLLSPLAALGASGAHVGFLVAAPDRGFLGNEEIRDHFDAFAREHNAELVFVTDHRTRDSAVAALARLKTLGAARAVVLPLFMSAAERRYAVLQKALAEGALPLAWARPFGASYFAVEALTRRLRSVHAHDGRRLVLVGSGAADAASAQRIAAELVQIGRAAAGASAYAAIDAAVWPERGAEGEATLRAAAEAQLGKAKDAVVVPLHLARKLDSMMAFNNVLAGAVPPGAHLLDEEPLTELALTWMRREANSALPWSPGEIGVVVAAHGSDWHWNQTMRDAAAPLAARHPVEYAFSMADPPIVERAVRRLEARGVRAIVVVRVFGLADSFEGEIRQLLGADVEAGEAAPAAQMAEHDSGHGHHGSHAGHGMATGLPQRIATPAVLLTAGGLDDHPLFARALLDRALALSRDPQRETIILTAHGTDDDARNARWLTTLESLAQRMRANGGERFRAIRAGTWREDWPDKSEAWVPRIRGWVEDAARDGTAIVIPARTNGTGPEKHLLAGLDYRLGSGFAPHPLFARWLQEQVDAAVAAAPRN